MLGLVREGMLMHNVKGRKRLVNEQDVVDLAKGDRVSKEREIWI
jgi:hypothetical protein